MTPEVSLKIIKKVLELTELLIEAKAEFKGVPPIPDYKKGAKEGLAIVTDNKGENYKEIIVTSNGQKITLSNNHKMPTREEMYDLLTKSQTENHFNDSIGYALNNPEVREKMFEKSKAYWKSFLDKSEPFAHPIENKEPKIDYNINFKQTNIEPTFDFSEKIQNAFAYWSDKYKKFESKEKCKHNRLRLNILRLNANEDCPVQCEDCGQLLSFQYWLNRNSNKECKHQKVTTTQHFDSETGKVIFTSKVCKDCNVDLLNQK